MVRSSIVFIACPIAVSVMCSNNVTVRGKLGSDEVLMQGAAVDWQLYAVLATCIAAAAAVQVQQLGQCHRDLLSTLQLSTLTDNHSHPLCRSALSLSQYR